MHALRSLLMLLFLGQFSMGFSQIDFDEKFPDHDYSFFLAEELKDRYLNTDLDSMRLLSESLLKRNNKLFFLGCRYLGSYYSRKGEFIEAIKLLNKSFTYFQVLSDYRQMSEICNEIGNANYQLSNIAEASMYYIESLNYGIQSEDRRSRFNGMLGLGKVHCMDGDTLLGIRISSVFLNNCIESNNYGSAADACAFLGMIFFDLGDKPVAKMYYAQSVAYAKKSTSKTHIANALTNQAIIDAGNDQMTLAEKNFLLAKECREDLGAKKPIIDAHFNLGTFYIMNERYEEADDYLIKASEIAKEAGMIRDEYDALEVLLLAFPNSFIEKNQTRFGKRFEFLKELLAKKKEISFEVRELSSQIAKTGSAEMLNERKIDRFFWLWLGFFAILLSCSLVFYLNRARTKSQFSL